MQKLQNTIDQTFANANVHTKKILGRPMNSGEVIRLINTGKPFTSGFTAKTKMAGPTSRGTCSPTGKTICTCALLKKTVTYYNLVQRKSLSIANTDTKGASAVFIEGEARPVGKAS